MTIEDWVVLFIVLGATCFFLLFLARLFRLPAENSDRACLAQAIAVVVGAGACVEAGRRHLYRRGKKYVVLDFRASGVPPEVVFGRAADAVDWFMGEAGMGVSDGRSTSQPVTPHLNR